MSVTNEISESTSSSSGKSQSTSNSQSTSSPEAVQTPQSEFSLALSEMLDQIAGQQLDWANQQYNTGLGVTEANINDAIGMANNAYGQSQDLWNQYQDIYQPLNPQLVQQAEEYASPAMQNFEAGQAQSDANQAGTAAQNNEEQQLQAYGVNPNSGRYADLLAASNTATAASEAAAGTSASLATKQSGLQQEQAQQQAGMQLPGQAVNALASAYTGVGQAENDILGQENAGANLENMPANYYSDAANALKLPPVGQNTQSTSNSQSTSQNASASQSQSQPGPNSSSGGSSGGGGGSYTENNDAPLVPFSTTSGPSSITQVSTLPPSGDDSGGGSTDGSGGGGSVDEQPSGGDDSGGDFGGASGGQVPPRGVLPTNATTGGPVPRSASPSHGRVTDDIPARLNADEWVIPRDVKQWEGEKFFHDLVAKSRAKRQQMMAQTGAEGSMKPPLPNANNPTFVSRHMPAHGAGGVI